MDEDPLDRHHYVAVAAVVAVVLVLALWLLANAYLLNLGGTHKETVPAGATFEPVPSNETGEPGTVTVTWTSNPATPEQEEGFGSGEPRHADYLAVSWAADDGTDLGDSADIGHDEQAVTVTDGRWRLAEVGHSVTLSERNATSATTVRVVVTAVTGETETMVYARTVTL